MSYKIIIFDVDATLLDYDVSEKNAFINTMLECNIACDDNLTSIFIKVCWEEWDKLHLGNTNEAFIQENYHKLYYQYAINRFEKFKEILIINRSAQELSSLYLDKFSLERTLMPYAIETCENLSCNAQLIIATNGC